MLSEREIADAKYVQQEIDHYDQAIDKIDREYRNRNINKPSTPMARAIQADRERRAIPVPIDIPQDDAFEQSRWNAYPNLDLPSDSLSDLAPAIQLSDAKSFSGRQHQQPLQGHGSESTRSVNS